MVLFPWQDDSKQTSYAPDQLDWFFFFEIADHINHVCSCFCYYCCFILFNSYLEVPVSFFAHQEACNQCLAPPSNDTRDIILPEDQGGLHHAAWSKDVSWSCEVPPGKPCLEFRLYCTTEEKQYLRTLKGAVPEMIGYIIMATRAVSQLMGVIISNSNDYIVIYKLMTPTAPPSGADVFASFGWFGPDLDRPINLVL